MRITLNWLKRFLDTTASVQEICDKLTSLGFEVEEIIDRAKDFDGFVVAEIISTKQHPNADKLKVCDVNTGSEIIEIVCGASNARAGIKVALAKPGCIIPNGNFEIKKSQIRGVTSNGMLCSYEEINIEPPQNKKDFDGIIELNESSIVGQSLAKCLGFDDTVIEISVTPNRGDVLSILGIARELIVSKIAKPREWYLGEINRETNREVNGQVNSGINKSEINKNVANSDDNVAIKNIIEKALGSIEFKKLNLGVTKDLCGQIYFIKIDKIKNVESPDWIKNYLKNVGIKTISAVVDIVNYVAHSLGQPMHAYDAARVLGEFLMFDSDTMVGSSSAIGLTSDTSLNKFLDSGLNTSNSNYKENSGVNILPFLKVDPAIEGEEILALDNKSYKLSAGDIVIRDNDGSPQALAGIIGCLASSCTMETCSIILESAVFDAIKIFKTASRLNIHTDSRMRFERGVDKNMSKEAVIVAANLIQEICGGDVVGYYCDELDSQNEQEESGKLNQEQIKISAEFINKKLGTNIELLKIREMLQDLGFSVTGQNNSSIVTGQCDLDTATSQNNSSNARSQNYSDLEKDLEIEVVPPSFRYDIKIKEDIVEEIARIIGYDNINSSKLEQKINVRCLAKHQRDAIISRRVLSSLGYNEFITWSFMDSKKSNLFFEKKEELIIVNPISSNLNYMRETILPNLLDVVSSSNARSMRDVELFEIGPVFSSNQLEKNVITGIRTSVDKNKYYFRYSSSDKSGVKNSDEVNNFYFMKGDFEILLSELGVNADVYQISDDKIPNYFHKKRAAAFSIGKKIIGYVGQINPKICKEFDIKDDVFGFELFLDELPMFKPKFGKRKFKELNDYQVIERDFCFIIDKKKCKVGEIIDFIKKVDKELIAKVDLFDIYESSTAVRVFIQPISENLSNDDITELYSKIINKTEEKFECKLKL